MIISAQRLAARATGNKPIGKGIKSFAMSALALKAMNSMMGASGNHSAFIKSDGSLWTMGKNDEGQLANSTNSDLNTPTIVSLGSFAVSLGNSYPGATGVSLGASFSFAKVAIGGGHTIYVSTEGTEGLIMHTPPGEMWMASLEMAPPPPETIFSSPRPTC